MSVSITLHEHPALDLGVFLTEFPETLGESPSPPWLLDLLRADAEAPFERSDEIRAAVRNCLRQGGYKPTGRGKPASEYLVRAADDGKLGTINLAVDACNAVSLHSGLPISVVDADFVEAPLSVRTADPEAEYVFNASGQTMRFGGLVVLHDAAGPCANAVKDSQRTKTTPDTRRVISLVWGTRVLEGRTAAAVGWYRELLTRAGATTSDVSMVGWSD